MYCPFCSQLPPRPILPFFKKEITRIYIYIYRRQLRSRKRPASSVALDSLRVYTPSLFSYKTGPFIHRAVGTRGDRSSSYAGSYAVINRRLRYRPSNSTSAVHRVGTGLPQLFLYSPFFFLLRSPKSSVAPRRDDDGRTKGVERGTPTLVEGNATTERRASKEHAK